MLLAELSVRVGPDHYRFAGLSKASAPQLASAFREGAAESPSAPPPAEPLDLASRVRELADLRDQGLLSDEELEAGKKRILGT